VGRLHLGDLAIEDAVTRISFIAAIAYNEGTEAAMAQLTVRNVPEEVVQSLRVRAAKHGRSAEAEHRLILADVLGGAPADFWAQADALRRTGRKQRSESGALLREMRDAR
jgi:plasmid stability protein